MFFAFRETSRKPRPKAIYTPLRPSTFLSLSVGFKFRESSQVSLVLLLFDLEDSNVAVNFLSFPFPVIEHGSVFVVFPGSVLFRKGLELRSSQEFQTDLSRRPATSQTGEFSRKSVCFSANRAVLGDLCSDLGFSLISRPFFDFWCWFASFCQFLYVYCCFFSGSGSNQWLFDSDLDFSLISPFLDFWCLICLFLSISLWYG